MCETSKTPQPERTARCSGPDPLVLDRHLPPGERNEPRARRLMGVEQGRAPKVRHPAQASGRESRGLTPGLSRFGKARGV